MGTYREWKRAKELGDKIMFYWTLFVIFILVPVMLLIAAIFG